VLWILGTLHLLRCRFGRVRLRVWVVRQGAPAAVALASPSGMQTTPQGCQMATGVTPLGFRAANLFSGV